MVIAAAFALAFTPATLVLRLGAALGATVAVYGAVTLLLGSQLARQTLGLLWGLLRGSAPEDGQHPP